MICDNHLFIILYIDREMDSVKIKNWPDNKLTFSDSVAQYPCLRHDLALNSDDSLAVETAALKAKHKTHRFLQQSMLQRIDNALYYLLENV